MVHVYHIMVPWYSSTNGMVPYHGMVLPVVRTIMVPWYHGTMVLEYHLVPWYECICNVRTYTCTYHGTYTCTYHGMPYVCSTYVPWYYTYSVYTSTLASTMLPWYKAARDWLDALTVPVTGSTL